MPSEEPARGVARTDSHSWTSGVWCVEDRVGLRRHTKIYPQFTSLLRRYVHALMPSLAFAAVACFTNLAAGVHTHPNDEPGSLNWIAPLTSFVGGQVKTILIRPNCYRWPRVPALLTLPSRIPRCYLRSADVWHVLPSTRTRLRTSPATIFTAS